jgi:hypothetical protein
MRLVTAERQWPEALDASYTVNRFGNFPAPPPDQRSGLTVPVVASWGRWTVLCPTPSCGGAALAHEDDHRFMCVDCGNVGAGWHEVRWPVNVESIDALLARRPIPATRNWTPGETLEQLRQENIAHAVEPGPTDPAKLQSALGYRRAAS